MWPVILVHLQTPLSYLQKHSIIRSRKYIYNLLILQYQYKYQIYKTHLRTNFLNIVSDSLFASRIYNHTEYIFYLFPDRKDYESFIKIFTTPNLSFNALVNIKINCYNPITYSPNLLNLTRYISCYIIIMKYIMEEKLWRKNY